MLYTDGDLLEQQTKQTQGSIVSDNRCIIAITIPYSLLQQRVTYCHEVTYTLVVHRSRLASMPRVIDRTTNLLWIM